MSGNGSTGQRQRDKILALLKGAQFQPRHPLGPGAWVSLRQIILLGIAQYSARISELRKELAPQGFAIVNDTLWDEIEQRKHSYYRLALTGERKARR